MGSLVSELSVLCEQYAREETRPEVRRDGVNAARPLMGLAGLIRR